MRLNSSKNFLTFSLEIRVLFPAFDLVLQSNFPKHTVWVWVHVWPLEEGGKKQSKWPPLSAPTPASTPLHGGDHLGRWPGLPGQGRNADRELHTQRRKTDQNLLVPLWIYQLLQPTFGIDTGRSTSAQACCSNENTTEHKRHVKPSQQQAEIKSRHWSQSGNKLCLFLKYYLTTVKNIQGLGNQKIKYRSKISKKSSMLSLKLFLCKHLNWPFVFSPPYLLPPCPPNNWVIK